MMDAVLVTTHLLAFGLGALSFKALTVWEAGRLTPQEGRAVAATPRTVQLRTAVLVLVILLCLGLVGFGFQQGRYQKQQDEHDACVTSWARDLTGTIKTRVKAGRSETNAEHRRDDALDNVVLYIVSVRSADPPPDEDQADRGFSRVLARFVRARSHMDEVTRQVGTKRKNNPYPRLSCP